MSRTLLSLCQDIYQAAARTGFLTECEWRPSDGSCCESTMVSLQTNEQSVLNQLTLSAETYMTYLTGQLPGLRQGEQVTINECRFQVREVVAISGGSEMRAKLSQVKKEY